MFLIGPPSGLIYIKKCARGSISGRASGLGATRRYDMAYWSIRRVEFLPWPFRCCAL